MAGGLFKVASAEAKLNLGARIGREEDITNTTREILEKTMHDATFDIAYDYINAKKLETGDNQNDDSYSYGPKDIKYGIKLCNKNIGFNGKFYTFL